MFLTERLKYVNDATKMAPTNPRMTALRVIGSASPFSQTIGRDIL
jgi:hypothetical protein